MVRFRRVVMGEEFMVEINLRAFEFELADRLAVARGSFPANKVPFFILFFQKCVHNSKYRMKGIVVINCSDTF